MFFEGVLAVRVLIWEARQRAGLTLQQLEARCSIGKSTLNRLENGQTSPRLEQLERIARALGCRVADLYTEKE